MEVRAPALEPSACLHHLQAAARLVQDLAHPPLPPPWRPPLLLRPSQQRQSRHCHPAHNLKPCHRCHRKAAQNQRCRLVLSPKACRHCCRGAALRQPRLQAPNRVVPCHHLRAVQSHTPRHLSQEWKRCRHCLTRRHRRLCCRQRPAQKRPRPWCRHLSAARRRLLRLLQALACRPQACLLQVGCSNCCDKL